MERYQNARSVLEIIAREAAPAIVDTRSQFALAPADILTAVGATNVAPQSSVLLWIAPLGQGGGRECLGYYLYRDEPNHFYRLKRICIDARTASGDANPYYPGQPANTTDTLPRRTNPTTADWFTGSWNSEAFAEEDPNNTTAVVSSVADGVIGFWIQPLDLLGNAIPLASQSSIHPSTRLYFNSAAYFEMATTTPFANGKSFLYLAQTSQSLKANRLPAAVELTLVVLSKDTIARTNHLPEQTQAIAPDGSLDVAASRDALQSALQKQGIHDARIFTTKIRLTNGN